MDRITRRRLWRRLEALPDERLYQVLDYIEFLESRYADRPAAPPGGIQRFAERMQDRMRIRSVAPRVVRGTLEVLGALDRVVERSDRLRRAARDGLAAGLGDAVRPPAATDRNAGGAGRVVVPIEGSGA